MTISKAASMHWSVITVPSRSSIYRKTCGCTKNEKRIGISVKGNLTNHVLYHATTDTMIHRILKISVSTGAGTHGLEFVSEQFPDLPFTSHPMFSNIITCKSPGQHGKGLALTNEMKRKAGAVRMQLFAEQASISDTCCSEFLLAHVSRLRFFFSRQYRLLKVGPLLTISMDATLWYF